MRILKIICFKYVIFLNYILIVCKIHIIFFSTLICKLKIFRREKEKEITYLFHYLFWYIFHRTKSDINRKRERF